MCFQATQLAALTTIALQQSVCFQRISDGIISELQVNIMNDFKL